MSDGSKFIEIIKKLRQISRGPQKPTQNQRICTPAQNQYENEISSICSS